jgi:hypothetical protein
LRAAGIPGALAATMLRPETGNEAVSLLETDFAAKLQREPTVSGTLPLLNSFHTSGRPYGIP